MENILMMAIAEGKDNSNITPAFRRYQGLGTFTLAAVNPNKAELEKLLNISLEKEVEYITKNKDGKDMLRLDFYLQTVPDKCGDIDAIIKATYFLVNSNRLNKDNTKVQIINAYGETAWLTREQFTNKQGPSNMPNYIMKDVRPAYQGEEAIVKFVKRFLAIPAVGFLQKSGEYKRIENPALAECQFGKIKDYFKGNIKEITLALEGRKTNKIKMLCGVNSVDGKLYQDVFTETPLAVNGSVDKLASDLMDAKNNGRYPNTDFGQLPFTFKEFEANPTPISSLKENVNPFGDENPIGGTDSDFEDMPSSIFDN